MKFSLALTALTAAVVSANPFAPAQSANSAKAKYMSKLIRSARPTENSQLGRKLEEADDEAEEYEVDISGYSLKFEQCQFVKAYDDELAESDSETVLATKRFVIFRLCPSGYCDSCTTNFGEYIVDLDEYLEASVDYQKDMQDEMCNACAENCQNDDQAAEAEEEEEEEQNDEDNGRRRKLDYNENTCASCSEECMKIANMADNGYIDATQFLQCQMIYDAEDDQKSALYAGPMCASYGSKIKIGVFTDDECNVPDNSKDVEDYLMDGDGGSMHLSHALLKTVYSSDCISCLKPVEEEENDDYANYGQEEAAAEALDMCTQLYEASAKCEVKNGLDSGYSNYNENQEKAVCNFVESLRLGSYDEAGEIVLNGASGTTGGGSETTGGQKFALTLFILGTAGLAGYASVLHSKLTRGISGLSGFSGLTEPPSAFTGALA